jgi:predicted tellurium resistance membrane protein TerC
MEAFMTSAGLVSLLTLTALEIILGIDNVIFISIVTEALPKHQEKTARIIGLLLAMAVRVALLMVLTSIISVGESELFSFMDHSFTVRSLILLLGGLFLIGKSTTEIHKKIEEDDHGGGDQVSTTMAKAIFQIVLIDVVFSFDSILTAVGLVQQVPIMIAAVIISMLVMIGFSQMISDFIAQHPTFKVLALAFLVLVGFLLVLEGFHVEVDKGYVYFAIAFAFTVEMVNTKIRKARRKAA